MWEVPVHSTTSIELTGRTGNDAEKVTKRRVNAEHRTQRQVRVDAAEKVSTSHVVPLRTSYYYYSYSSARVSETTTCPSTAPTTCGAAA